MSTVIGIIIVIGGVVLIHELGHFSFAKWVGMRVERFSVGFPPRLFGKKIGETDFCISAIPLGGYVKVAGIIDESVDTDGVKGEPWEFQSKNSFQKLLYITGGVLYNLLFAIFIFCLLSFGAGVYEANPDPVIDQVIPDFPADRAGLQTGDRIVAINDSPVRNWETMTTLIHALPNDSITIRWQRGEQVFQQRIATLSTKTLKGFDFVETGLVGISPRYEHHRASLGEAIQSGLNNTWYWTKVTIVSLKLLVTGRESVRNLGGPILIAQLAGQSARSGLAALFGLMAVISINLALVNILPIPALDGGHALMTLIEAIRRRPLSLKAKIRFQQIGLAFILTMMVIVFYNDILRLIKGF